MMKRRPAKGGVDQLGGDLPCPTPNTMNLQPELAAYQALRLIHIYAIRPELAVMLAALAFGCGQ